MSIPPVSYKRHRFPRELIAHAVWLYFRFPLSFRLIEEMLLERGMMVSYETIRRWSLKFGVTYARRLKRKAAKPGDVWHLDEVRIVIGGQVHWLWRAVDQDGYILDEILQTRRNTKAAQRLLTRLLRKQGVRPRRIITDKLKSYGAAKRKLRLSVRHLSHKGLNNRAENSHLPLRKRERVMQKFRSPSGCQRFLTVFSAVRNLFVPPTTNTNALTRHNHLIQAFAQWNVVTSLAA
ncbi:IS6 family transposase [Swingsia samuiensis]|uniref:IS6 family transposase n=1 Tax=Swingsia samuiensis TaxID=1293412 RepID=A0A4Y6UM30_9PROT|nr:IS6 family transposase [Swingsia samuiensis]QDH18104.1 IS6 family transposase [Swingsia samuiensis]